MRTTRLRSLAPALLLLALFPAATRAQATCTNVGKERWTVKTTAPLSATKKHPTFTAESFAKIPEPPNINAPGQKTLESRYTEAIDDSLHEGELVSITGYVQLIKTSPDDCDYHIQITPTAKGDSGTIIVEIPDPDAAHVSDPDLRAVLTAARDSIRKQLKLTREPGSGGSQIGGRAYMEFQGALFFDATHDSNCAGRGTGTPAVTCWELHPVVLTRFAPKPG
jgi:hypothetical protein